MLSSVHNLCGRGRIWILLLAPFLSLMVFYLWLKSHANANSALLDRFLDDLRNNGVGDDSCRRLPGMEEMLVVLKTGVTESLEKVPVHVQTTLRCVPHYVIFSDYEESVAGVATYDVLHNVSNEIKQSIGEFELYNRVRQLGRDGLSQPDYGDDFNGPFGRVNNPGWKLDKWKFLPMIDVALEVRPEAKWYIFMEADTYLVWPNLVAWLAQLDAERPLYLGSQMQIGDAIFGYGGSGFIISNPAMQKVAEHRAEHLEELDRLTVDEWAGDCVLGKALAGVGVPLTWSWPMLQGSRPWDLDHFSEGYDRKTWCFPVGSYHHMLPADIEELWQFDQRWFNRPEEPQLLLHGDIFRGLILPEILSPRMDWDNLSEDAGSVEKEGEEPDRSGSFDDCKKRCIDNDTCLQYALHPDGQCMTSKVVKRGERSATVQSGWMADRILPKVDELGSACSQTEFIFP